MKAIMTSVALAALIAGAPAVAGERLQLAQADQQTEPMQEETLGAAECPEGATETAEGEPCPADATAAAPEEEPAESEAAAAPEEPASESEAAAMEEEPAATEEGGEAIEAAETEEPQAEESEMVAAEGGKFIGEQGDDAVLASELVGLTVYNPADEALGDVNDIVWTADGGVEAVIVGVGGFLGIGEKAVAVTYSAVNISIDENGDKRLTLDATSEELAAAPEFVTTAEKLAMQQQEQQQQALPAAEGGGMTPEPAAPAQ